MNETLIFLAVGLGSLGALALWARRAAAPELPAEAAEKAQEVFESVQLDLPSRALAERIFDLQDCHFAKRNLARLDQRQFMRERQAIALAWLSQTRRALQAIMSFHRRAVRGSAQLEPAVEARLALSYLSFVVVYDLLFGLIWLRGPFGARTAISFAANTAEQLSYLSAQALASMDSARLSKIQAGL